VASWTAAIGDAADALAAAPPGHGWQRPELQRLLDDVQLQAGPRTLTLAPAELRALLADRLAGRPTRANFRTGHLTICTLMPMRSVPHRVVCLLGMDDGVFPRRSARDGDDLIADEPQVGDRDARSEDRQLLLDALLAAQERLIVTYTGNDERTNTPRPPAVPIGELLDALEQSTGVVRSGLVVRHPLQPFDPRNFTVGALVGERVWSFDRVALAGASALVGPRAAPAPFLGTGLEFDGGALLELDDLLRFTSHPTRAFLRRRLGISLGDFTTEVADALPVELDALDRWGVGERLLAARLRGLDLHAARAAEIARGALPPGQLAAPLVTREVEPIVERIAAAAQAVLGDAGPAGSVEVRVTLDDGRLLSGTVPGVYGDLVLTVAYSRLGPRARLAAWVRWLALVASHPERPWRAVTIGRGRGAGAALACLDPLPEGSALAEVRALARLATLVELYDEGMRGPLPLALRSSAAYAEAARVGQDAVKAARSKWDSGFSYDGEDREAEHALVFGGAIEIESNEFHRCALALWSGLLEVERSEQR
jgi:exodeoxyribonuclease V gamma subunit